METMSTEDEGEGDLGGTDRLDLVVRVPTWNCVFVSPYLSESAVSFVSITMCFAMWHQPPPSLGHFLSVIFPPCCWPTWLWTMGLFKPGLASPVLLVLPWLIFTSTYWLFQEAICSVFVTLCQFLPSELASQSWLCCWLQSISKHW